MKHLVERKSQFPCGMVSAPCSETGPNLRTSLFVDRWLSITKHCTEVNISILVQNKSTLRVLGEEISGNGISTIGKCKFTILQNEMVSIHIKIAFFHLNIWFIGQGGWKFCRRSGFDSCQFTAQADKWRWAGNGKFLVFKT